MNRENLVASLTQIRALATDCLNELGNIRVLSKEGSSHNVAQDQSATKALPKCILELRNGQFFKEARTAREVHEKLHSTYPCEFNRVAMALLRLKERKQLRKTSKVVGKKTQVAYVW